MGQGITSAPPPPHYPVNKETSRTLILISWFGEVPEEALVKLRFPYAMQHPYGEADE